VTYLAVSIAVPAADEVDQALAVAAGAVQDGARLVEWRLDELAGRPDDVTAACELVRRSPAPSIATCRGRAEGGGYDGDQRSRATLYEALILADHPPRYIDIELSAWLGSEMLRRTITAALGQVHDRDMHASLMLSTHDFRQRPTDLLQRIEAMMNEELCAVTKVAWQARSLRDNLEALDLVTERRMPTIALCMGPFGLMSRVLGAKAGALLVYASTGPGVETAPGQPPVAEFGNLYRFGKIDRATAVYGVIGWPVGQSLGPVIHNAGFEAVGHNGVYLPLPIPPEYEHFKATVGSMVDHERLGFRGASVTAPHKENLVRFVRERGGDIDALSRRLGAANTLVVSPSGALRCANTDASAFLESLCGSMQVGRSNLRDQRVALLGAGGVAGAVGGALADAGAVVVVFNRTLERALALVDRLGRPARVGDLGPLGGSTGSFQIVVNCTPVGMVGGPAPDSSPLPDGLHLDGSVTVLDTVYAPRQTPLLLQAQEAGARAIGGLDMFLRQAARQFTLWTGHEAPIEVFRRSIEAT